MLGDDFPQPFQVLIPDDYAGQRLDQALAQLLPRYSRARLQAWIKEGRITLAGRTPEPKTRVWGGEQVDVDTDTETSNAAKAEDIPLAIVHEDATLLVIDKPAGLVVHPGNGNTTGTLMNALLHHTPAASTLPRAGIVHRLDKDTSGLMMVARTEHGYNQLVRQLQARSVSRIYFALVVGRTSPSGSLSQAIGRHPTHRTRMAVSSRGRPAVTHFMTLCGGQRWSLVRCQLETGRTHQIRVHMAAIGHPLIGDPTYGSRGKEAGLPSVARSFPRQALHATELELTHPDTGIRMRWQRDPPEDFLELMSALEANDPSA